MVYVLVFAFLLIEFVYIHSFFIYWVTNCEEPLFQIVNYKNNAILALGNKFYLLTSVIYFSKALYLLKIYADYL